MQALGVDLATIQSLVGHADVDMTKHYLHVQDPIRIAAITKFDMALSEETEKHTIIIDFMKSLRLRVYYGMKKKKKPHFLSV